MKTLLQINETVTVTSTGRIAAQIGDLAISKGWNSYIAYGREERDCKSQLIRIGDKKDIIWHVLQTRLFDRHGLASERATRAFIKEMEKIAPNIIHLHNIHGYYLNFEVLFDYLGQIRMPVIWTLHDCWPITGHCSFFEGVGCNRWKTGCGSCPYLNDYPRSLFIDRSEENFRQKKAAFTKVKNLTLVPVSEWLGRLVEQSFLGKYNLRVIHNGTDLRTFGLKEVDIRRRLGIKTGKKIVLGVASVWHERKGLNDFVKLSSDKGLQVILVGVTDEIIKHLPDSIIAIKRTNNQQELAELYAGSDVLVNPTYDDNFPTTNIEALACGTPVITYNTGGSPEAIDESTGMVVEKGSIEGLRDAIETITNKSRNEFKQACRRRAENLYNKNDRFQDYLNLYEELLNE